MGFFFAPSSYPKPLKPIAGELTTSKFGVGAWEGSELCTEIVRNGAN
jgi:hypothetical protein